MLDAKYQFKKADFSTVSMCANTLTLEADSTESLDAVSKLITDEHGQVDFGVAVPIPDGVGKSITFLLDDKDQRYPEFNTTNPERIGAQTIESLLSLPWSDNKHVKEASYLNSDILDRSKTVEENLLHLVTSTSGPYPRHVNKLDTQMAYIGYSSHVVACLVALIAGDHEDWCYNKFGARTWVEWHNQRWGTLWCPENTTVTETTKGNRIIRTYKFDTPSTPPYSWFVHLANATRLNSTIVTLEAIYDFSSITNAKGIVVSCTGNIRIIPKVPVPYYP